MNRGQSEEQWGVVARLAVAVGAFVTAVSVGLFIHGISQLASPIVCAGFIAAGWVGRQRATTPAGQALALGALAGGIVAAIASISLAAAGR